MIFPFFSLHEWSRFSIATFDSLGGETRESSFSSGYHSNYSLLWLNMNLFSFNTSTSRVGLATPRVSRGFQLGQGAWRRLTTNQAILASGVKAQIYADLGSKWSKFQPRTRRSCMVKISILPLSINFDPYNPKGQQNTSGVCDAAAGRCTLPPNTSDALAWTGCATKSKRKRSESVHTSEEKETSRYDPNDSLRMSQSHACST